MITLGSAQVRIVERSHELRLFVPTQEVTEELLAMTDRDGEDPEPEIEHFDRTTVVEVPPLASLGRQ